MIPCNRRPVVFATAKRTRILFTLGVALVGVSVLSAELHAQTLRPGKTPFDQQGPLPQAQAQAAEAGQGDRVSVLVHVAPGADRGPLRGFAANRGGHVKYEYDVVLANVINIRGIPQAALGALANVAGVIRIEEDRQMQAHMNDSTPLIRALQSQINGAGLSADGTGIRVCIIDSGIDSDSAMYASRIDTAAGRDFVNNDNDPEDDAGHGSHVAGTAVGGDTLTVDFGCVGSEPFHGVAPQATLIGIKVLDAGGSGAFSDVIAGINYGADQTGSGGRCDVINMSLGGGAFSGSCDGDSAAAAANAAVAAGVVVVASSGNEANSNAMGTPACGSSVIAVGATYDDGFPNCEFPSQSAFTFCVATNIFGQCTGTCTDNSPGLDQITCMSNRSTELDVTAPGCITFSADKDSSPNGIVGFCGTSMASPHVAGLAALLLDADGSLTPADVRQLIRDGAIDLGAAGFDTVYGHGRIDAINSISLIGPGCTVPADCDDLDACTIDTCNSGTCSNTPMDCDDLDACTTDSCSGGTCFNDPVNCDDLDACTIDSCDSGTGCVNDPVSCPPGETCVGGVCEAPACNNDGNCEAGEDCNNCPNDCRAKSNGNPNSRYCCDGDLPDCGDSRCSESPWSCGGGGSCTSDPECDDGQFCNGAETCSGGTCQSGSDPCPGQSCDEGSDTCVSCGGNKDACNVNADCCSNNCKNGSCKGN